MWVFREGNGEGEELHLAAHDEASETKDKFLTCSGKKKLCEKRLHLEGNKSVEHFYNTCHWAASCLNQPKKQSSVPLSFPLFPTPTHSPLRLLAMQAKWLAGRGSGVPGAAVSVTSLAAPPLMQLLVQLFSCSNGFQLLLPYSYPTPTHFLPQSYPSPALLL